MRGEGHHVTRAEQSILRDATRALTLDIERTDLGQTHSATADKHIVDYLIYLSDHLLYFLLSSFWGRFSGQSGLPTGKRPFIPYQIISTAIMMNGILSNCPILSSIPSSKAS